MRRNKYFYVVVREKMKHNWKIHRIACALIVALLCINCFAATPIYVDPDDGNDANNGTTVALAKKTVDAAMNAVDDGGTVKCIAGTYTDATQGASWELEFDSGVDKSVTFEPNSSTAITWTFPAGTTRALEFYAGVGAGKTITFDTITLVITGSGYIRKLATNKHSIVFQDCTVDASASDFNYFIYAQAETTQASSITFTDCTVTAPNFLFGPEFDLNVVKFDGCTITAPDGFVYLDGAAVDLNTLIVKDCTITTTTADTRFIETGDFTTLGSIVLKGNTVSSTWSFIEWANPVTNRVLVEDNTITVTDAGPHSAIRLGYIFNSESYWDQNAVSYSVGGIAKNEGEIYECINAHDSGAANEPPTGANWQEQWLVAELAPVKVIGNTVSFSTEGQAHGIYIGFGCDYAEVSHNTVTGGDYQLVVKGRGCNVHHNILYGPQTLYLISRNGSMVWNNTCYSTANLSIAINPQETTYSSENIIVNNIFSGDTTHTYSMDIPDATTGVNNYVNYNCYLAGASGLVTLGGTACADLAAIQARWTAWSNTYPDNDANSIVADPLFMDAANADFRLKPTSPCLNAGRPTLGSGYTDMGAWQRISRIRR